MTTPLDDQVFTQRFIDTGAWFLGERHCRETLERCGDDAATWRQLGFVLTHRGRKIDAVAAYAVAAELDPASAHVHQWWSGKLAEESGDFHAAAEHYATALDCRPGFELARLAAHHNAIARREIAFARERTGDRPGPATATRFLLIKAWGTGFWSEIMHLLGALLTAEITERIPVVLWGANSLFREPGLVDGYTQFFEPVSDTGLDDLPVAEGAIYPPKWTPANLGTENVGKHDGPYARLSGARFVGRPEPLAVIDHVTSTHLARHWIPPWHPLHGRSTAAVDRWISDKYLRPWPFLIEAAETFVRRRFGAGTPFTAVHLRGTDKGAEAPLLDALNFHALDEAGAAGDVFVLTDSVRWQREAAGRLGARAHFAPATRGTGDTGIHFERAAGPTQLGEEVLTDALIAARASHFVGNGWSSVSCGVRLLSNAAPESIRLLGLFDVGRNHYGEYY